MRSFQNRLAYRLPCWLLAASLLFLTGCTGENQPPAGDGSATANELPWQGVKLRLIVADDGSLAEAIGRVRGEWKATTGAELDIAEATSSGLLSAEPPRGDVLIYPAYVMGVLVERKRLRPLPAKTLNSDELAWAEIFETDKTFDANWGAETYACPLGSPSLICLYRQDLLDKLGREPPNTWAEYQDLAALLADRGNSGAAAPPNDASWSGTMEPLAEGWAGLTLLARAAAYAKHRNHFSTLFDMETMDPLISGEPFVKALDELTAAKSQMPAAALDASPRDVHEAFLDGRCGMALTWTSAAWGAAGTDDAVADAAKSVGEKTLEVGFIELPGSPEAFNPKSRQWDSRRDDEASRVALVGVSGRLASVTAQSEHADAAFQLLAWLSGPRWSRRISTSSGATTLFRRSQVAAGGGWADERLGPAGALAYAETVERSLSSAESFGAPRIAGRDRYLAALDRAVRDAVMGKLENKAALKRAGEEWRAITDELGLDRQRAAYRRSLGLR